MSLRKKLRTVFVCSILEFASFTGVPLRAEDVQRLIQSLSRPRVARELPSEDDDGGGPAPSARGAGPALHRDG